LAGNEIEARFSADKKHITSLLSQGNAVYQSKEEPEHRTLTGDRIEFGIAQSSGALERIMIFGNAVFSSESEAGRQELHGATIRVDLDVERGTPLKIDSRSGVEFQIRRGPDLTVVTGDQLNAAFLPGSSQLDVVRVWDGARMSMRASGSSEEDELRAEELRIRFANLEGKSVPRELQADRSVRWTSAPRKDTSGRVQGGRTLSSSALTMRYAESGEVLDSGTASGGVILDGLQSGPQGQAQVRRLEADTVQFRFFPHDNRLREFEGDGHVRVLYQKPPDARSDAPAEEFRTSSSRIRATFFEQDGTAETVAQWGGFTYEDGKRTATAGRSDYNARTETLLLRESPKIVDEGATTTGEVMEYDQKDRILTVRRQVRSVLRPQRGGRATPFSSSSSSSPSVITAGSMQAWTGDSHARYSENVQMLSESGQLQAQSLEIFNSGERVEAQGDVHHLVPRRQTAPPAADVETGSKVKPAPPAKPSAPILIRSAGLQYRKEQNSIRYSGGVTLASEDASMSAETMIVFLDSEGRRIERARANGKIHIRQGDREVRGDEAEYLLAPGQFMVVGQLAEIQDPARGKSQARRLTFFTSDDRIVLENH
jgi:lipopolysaccharide export system protein LptA